MYSLSERWYLEATGEQRRELEVLAHSRDRMEADRARAVLGRLDGQTSPEIAKGLRTRPEQVRHWCSLFAHGGVAALRARPHPGRPPRTGEQALATVEQILAEPTPPGIVWTVARLRQEIRRRAGIDISEGHLGRVMKKKGGLRWRKPRHTLTGRQDAEAVEQFRQRLQDLNTQAEADEIILLYEDESEALTHPYLARMWAKKGADLRVQAPGKAEKCVLLGVREAVHQQLLVVTREQKCSADFLALLEEVERVYRPSAGPRPVVITLDHGTIHVSGISQRALAERADWLKVEWLPRYAPELNPIERDWQDLKQHYLANQAFQGLKDLESRVHRAIAAINGKRSSNPYQELCDVA